MPTPAYNVPFPFVLSSAALYASDRLSITLMTLVHAIADIAKGKRTASTLPSHAAQTLFIRLANLVMAIIRITNFGRRTPARFNPTSPVRPQPTPSAPRTPGIYNRPGWLLAALPGIAPAIASELQALLADPGLADLFSVAPNLHRTLRPFLRALGLTSPPPAPKAPPPRPTPHPQTAPSRPAPPSPAASPNGKNQPATRISARLNRYDVATNTPYP